jgi:hypothetical protein
MSDWGQIDGDGDGKRESVGGKGLPKLEVVLFDFHLPQKSPIHRSAADSALGEKPVLGNPPLGCMTTTTAAEVHP